MRAVVTTHASAISYESVDVLLERTPILDLRSLQQKMFAGARGGYDWFAANHPDRPYRSNLIAARPGPGRTRLTLFNARLNIRHASGAVERAMLEGPQAYRDALENLLGLRLTEQELAQALATLKANGSKGAPHPFFA